MEFEELKTFIQKLYPIQKVEFSFDNNCIAKIEFNLKNGFKQYQADIYYQKMLVSVQNIEPFYVDMPRHRETIYYKDALALLNTLEILIPETELQRLRDADVKRNLGREDHGREEIIQYLKIISGKSEDEILKLAGLPN